MKVENFFKRSYATGAFSVLVEELVTDLDTPNKFDVHIEVAEGDIEGPADEGLDLRGISEGHVEDLHELMEQIRNDLKEYKRSKLA